MSNRTVTLAHEQAENLLALLSCVLEVAGAWSEVWSDMQQIFGVEDPDAALDEIIDVLGTVEDGDAV